MARIAFGLLLLLIAAHFSSAQAPPPIGFVDQSLFNDSLRYTAFGYKGPAPLFVQAWFPLKEAPETPTLTYVQPRTPPLDPFA